MIANNLVKHYPKVTVKNPTNGQVQNTFPAVAARLWVDVQPAGLTKEEAARWGQTDIAANSKIVFLDPYPAAKMLDRFVDSTDNGYYEVKGINPWPIHHEMLWSPIQGQDAPVAVDGVSVSPSTVVLAPLATQQLTVTFTPLAPSSTALVWTSSDITKATVSSTGLVTTLVTGVATITATTVDGGFTSTCVVTVSV